MDALRKIKSIIALSAAISFGGLFAEASDNLPNLPNNTNTQLATYSSQEGVISILEAYVSRHLYGQDVILKLLVKDFDYNKKIYLQSISGTHHASFVNNATEFSQGGAWAIWGADDVEYDIIYVKIPTLATISWSGVLSPHDFAVYIKMAGNEYRVTNIRLKLKLLY